MLGPWKPGMATRLMLAFAAVILPLALFTIWSYQQSLDDRREAALQDQEQLAQTAGAVMSGILRDFDTTMLGLSIALAGQQRPLNQESVGPLLAAMAGRYPFVRAIFLIGPDGRVLASPSGGSVGTDLGAQPYTRALLGGQDFVLTDIIPGAETGSPLVVMGRTVRAGGGDLRGMLAFAFYPSAIASLFPETLPEGAILNVVDRRGHLIFSSADPEIARENRDAGNIPIVRAALNGEIASDDHFISPVSGDERIGAAVPVEFGWVVTVSRSRASVEGRLDELFRRQILVVAAVTTAALLLAWFLSRALTRPLAALADEATRFGHGELERLPPVSGPPEVESLARALNVMGDELQTRFAEREAALEQTRAALAVRDQFLSVAAHELRTPLTALKGQVQIARRRLQRGVDTEALETFLVRADMQVDRLTSLINDLLDVSRIAAGRFVLDRELIDPEPVIRRAVELEQGVAAERTIALEISESLPAVEIDAARIEQVLINLLENARKYSPPSTPVVVAAGAPDGLLEVSVRDQGAGIPDEDQRAIFERFRRAGNVDRNISGLGLGLYIVDEIVRAHGGQMDVESRPGQGSTFRMVLPIPAARRPQSTIAEAARADG